MSDEDRAVKISRRAFVKMSAVGGSLTLPGLGGWACRGDGSPGEPRSLALGQMAPFELEEVTVDGLQEAMTSGRLTARSIVEMYLDRIEKTDRQGPELHSILETNPDAIALADALDRERRQGRTRGPLHGIPVLLKDNIATADRMTTTAGSLALEGSIPSRDSIVAQKLRAAGAVLLAKTNLSEWANYRSTRSSSGWSARGGQCRNPYALDRNPCGSSSGSGAATSANLGAVSIGTETDGSIVCPSNANGLVGVKPTVGLVSRSGIIPISHSQDTAGPMTRTVRDAAILLGAIAGVDPRDRATTAIEGQAPIDYTGFLDPNGLKGARLGVARAFFGFHPEVDRALEEALGEMRRSGAELLDVEDLPQRSAYSETENLVMASEFKADLNQYLADLGESAPVKSLAEVIAFNEANAEHEMPYFGQEIFFEAQASDGLESKAYRAALAFNHRISRAEGIDRLLGEHRLEALVAPTGGPAWVTDLLNGDHFSGDSSGLSAIAGYPMVTVPAGFVRGLPIGISFIGSAWSEPGLLKLAFAFEQATRIRRPPRFLSTAEL